MEIIDRMNATNSALDKIREANDPSGPLNEVENYLFNISKQEHQELDAMNDARIEIGLESIPCPCHGWLIRETR